MVQLEARGDRLIEPTERNAKVGDRVWLTRRTVPFVMLGMRGANDAKPTLVTNARDVPPLPRFERAVAHSIRRRRLR